MSTSDPFLPVQGEDALNDDAPLEREDHDSEDGSRPDVFPESSDDSEDASAENPPVADSTVFRTPSGESADPPKD